jgi:hypothetical protein
MAASVLGDDTGWGSAEPARAGPGRAAADHDLAVGLYERARERSLTMLIANK